MAGRCDSDQWPRLNAGSVSVYIERSTFTGCKAASGGAFAINGGARLFVGDATVIQDGQAENGGAIHCQDSAVYLGPRSTLSGNRAVGGDGGALFADDCAVTVLSRRSDASELRNNRATRHGGLIYAVNGSGVLIDGGANCERQPQEFSAEECDPTIPVLVRGNAANLTAPEDAPAQGDGGAIYASGQSTLISADGVIFENNSAWLGGAVAVRSGARLELGVTSFLFRIGDGCGFTPCVDFVGNTADARGGALFLEGAGRSEIWFSEFRGNSASFGSAISLNNQPANGAHFNPANSVFAGNGNPDESTADIGLIELAFVGGSEVNLGGVTIVDNTEIQNALFYSRSPNEVSNVSIKGSVLIGSVPIQLEDLNGKITGLCVASNLNLPPQYDVSISNENFALPDAATRDYRPRRNSIAVDRCAQADLPGIAGSYDFLWNPRPKLGSVFSAATPLDAGAIELQIEPNDHNVFWDRFQELPPPN